MWKQRLKKVWAAYRHVSAVRGLLQWLGWWKYLVLLCNATFSVMIGYWASHIANFTKPIAILIGLLSFAAVLLIVVLGVAMRRIIAEEIPPKPNSRWPDLLLRTGMTDDGLLVWLENQTDHAIKDCSLFLAQIHRYSEQTRSFSSRMLSGVTLIRTQTLSAHDTSSVGYFIRLPDTRRKFLTTPDAMNERPEVVINEAGIWKATINVIVGDELHAEEHLCFKWQHGSMPEYTRQPKVAV